MQLKKIFQLFLGACALLLCIVFSANWYKSYQKKQNDEKEILAENIEVEPVIEKQYRFGIAIDDYEVISAEIKRGQAFSDILTSYNIGWDQIIALADTSKNVFNLSKLRAGNEYTLYNYLDVDSLYKPAFFLYQISPTDFLRLSLKDSCTAKLVSLPIETQIKTGTTTIKNNLYDAFQVQNLPVSLALKLSDIYAWTIDFYRLNKKDAFSFVYESHYAEGKPVGIGKILAATYISGDDTLDAFRYYHEELEEEQYFSSKGENLQKSMLKTPVKFGRISSNFSLRRFHPVQKRYKAHLGTDYAAAHGTPIFAVGNGTVLEAKRGRYNGNYVKIKHNKTYTSQYLHMSRFAAGMRPGKKVSQGEVIGYVGSTGLATGPHVCFRLWKNGKQVNHLRENFSPAEPLPTSQMNAFANYSDSLSNILSGIQ